MEERPESPPPSKKKKRKMKVSPSSSGLCSLPDDVAVNCLAQLSRFDLAALAMASKSHRALVSSPKLLELRRRMGCIEPCLYVCLRISGSPRWFVLNPNHRRLNPVPSNPNQAPELSSFVAVDGGIYVMGGLINDRHTSDVWFLDCFSHKWNRVPSMKMPRASARASLVDGKIYICGGRCKEEEGPKNWAEVFDLKSQTWGRCSSRKVHPNRADWCAIGKLLFCRGPREGILWCDFNERHWKHVRGLEYCDIRICRLCTNSAGNIVIFWISRVRHTWLCSAEISLQREGGEIWGKVEWSDTVFKLDDTLSHSSSSSGLKVLYSASVLVSC